MKEPLEGKMPGTSSPEAISTRLQRIAELAQEAPDRVLTTLHHHIDLEWLGEAYRRTRKDGAVGVDGQTAESYAADLEGNLRSLLDRFKSGSYRAQPVRRVHIPKGDGRKTRPIGVPAFEDKVLQRAVVMVMEPIYEQEFYDCSYGFRPGRSARQALQELWMQLTKWRRGWVLELDIRSFFDTLVHSHLRDFLDRRVRDGVLRRTIDKWLTAGVMEEGAITRPESGTPQGGVISPLLANIYLHEVLDRWFHEQIQTLLERPAFLLRFADDAVLCFQSEADARRVLAVLPKRFARFGLTLHPEKTRLIRFHRPSTRSGSDPSPSNPGRGTFDLLGFTHYWARSRQGRWVIRRRTAKDRLRRALQRISMWCQEHRHHPVRWQHSELARKVSGHMAYYGITGNVAQLSHFVHEAGRLWHKWLCRRGRSSKMNWDRFNLLLQRYPLPRVRIVHQYSRHAANP
jgi:group II intron reverse transcriptase/maturase